MVSWYWSTNPSCKSSVRKEHYVYMKNEPRVCPVCGKTYYAAPALSRRDNATEICPDCGMQEAIDTAEMADYEIARSRLSFDVIATDGHSDLLDTVPHFAMADLSILFRVRFSENAGHLKSILITNEMMANYGITVEELRKDTSETAPAAFPIEYMSIAELFADTFRVDMDDSSDIMYAASVRCHVRGAGVIAYPDFFTKSSDKMGGDFFILPSSIHEVIILKDDGTFNAQSLTEIVSDINSSVVLPQDRLTDNAYHYDCSSQLFETAAEFEERTQQ